jgi:hypothetical protein
MNNNFEKVYDPKQKDWQKSVNEFSKFFLDNSKDVWLVDQKEFENKEEKIRAERVKTRLAELLEKATKRLGYKIDENKLIAEAYQHILDLKESGELAPSNLLENFCAEIKERLEKAA